jgi:hypothetical protein
VLLDPRDEVRETHLFLTNFVRSDLGAPIEELDLEKEEPSSSEKDAVSARASPSLTTRHWRR